ncbi:MAG TPA: OB-fold domain-containing protein [Acidimicrobiia bacterium]|nr:OB-fold domain-containing protein [Acidimicrobiia bacterium]
MTAAKSDTAVTGDEPVTMMEYFMSLTYTDVVSPPVVRFREALMEGRLIAQQCPKCHLVYVPPKGYCPIDTIELDERNEIQLADRGVVTNYTIVTPVQYYGQKETEPFVRASILLDPPGGMLILQDILDIPTDEVRAGMRVEAVWAKPGERNVDEVGNRSGSALEGSLRGFRPTGEPDVPADSFSDKVW